MCATLLLSSGDAPFSCVSRCHSCGSRCEKCCDVSVPRDVARALGVSVLEMRWCHIARHPMGMRRFCDFLGSWCTVKVSRKSSRLETSGFGLRERTCSEAESIASFRGLAGGAAREPGPLPSLCFCSCPNQVLGGGPGEVKTWSQPEVGIEQPLSLDIWTSQPL